MARYQVILAYDGTGFQGSQRQVNIRTVQGELEKSLRKYGWSEKSVLMAGRTDTGVHATGQVAVLEVNGPYPDNPQRDDRTEGDKDRVEENAGWGVAVRSPGGCVFISHGSKNGFRAGGSGSGKMFGEGHPECLIQADGASFRAGSRAWPDT